MRTALNIDDAALAAARAVDRLLLAAENGCDLLAREGDLRHILASGLVDVRAWG